MNYATPISELEHPAPPPAAAKAETASFRSISKQYRLDAVTVDALNDVTCALPLGETTFVVGPSGSGKTTFLNILGLIDRPSAGRLVLLGEDVTDLTDSEAADFRSRHIGFIFQSFNLIPVLSLRENVELPLLRHMRSSRARRQRASHYLDAVGLADMMERRPGETSGGQRQRAAIARALVTEPDIVIADEPTANLDTGTSSEIVALLDRMKSTFNTSVVICTHNIDLIQPESALIQITDGRLVNGGPN